VAATGIQNAPHSSSVWASMQPRLRIRCAKTASLAKARSPCPRREAKDQFHRRRAVTGKPVRRCPIRWQGYGAGRRVRRLSPCLPVYFVRQLMLNCFVEFG
jgi:hypothetical protein